MKTNYNYICQNHFKHYEKYFNVIHDVHHIFNSTETKIMIYDIILSRVDFRK